MLFELNVVATCAGTCFLWIIWSILSFLKAIFRAYVVIAF